MGLLTKAASYLGVESHNLHPQPSRSRAPKPNNTLPTTGLPNVSALLPNTGPLPQTPFVSSPGVKAALSVPSFNPVFESARAALRRPPAGHNARSAGSVRPQSLRSMGPAGLPHSGITMATPALSLLPGLPSAATAGPPASAASNGRPLVLQSPPSAAKKGFHPLYALGEAMGGLHPLQALAVRTREAVNPHTGVVVGDEADKNSQYTLVDWLKMINHDEPDDDPTPEGHIGHPAVMENHRRQVWKDHYHPDQGYELWSPQGANMGEVVQGQAGDCYWLAALASGLGSGRIKPEQFIRPVPGQPDVYDVFFHPPDAESPTGWSSQVEAIRVDACLPHSNSDKHLYADGVDTAHDGRVEDAVAIAEKAAAVFAQRHQVFCEHLPENKRKGYDAIGNGGFPGDAISSLTGEATETLFLERATPQAVEHMLRAAEDEGKMVVIGTRRFPNRPLVGQHAYSVLGIEEEPGARPGDPPKKMVVLRNPWGIESPWSAGGHLEPPSLDQAFDHSGGGLDWFLDRDALTDAHVDPNDPGQFKVPLEQVHKSVFMVTANVQSPLLLAGGGTTSPNPKPIVY